MTRYLLCENNFFVVEVSDNDREIELYDNVSESCVVVNPQSIKTSQTDVHTAAILNCSKVILYFLGVMLYIYMHI